MFANYGLLLLVITYIKRMEIQQYKQYVMHKKKKKKRFSRLTFGIHTIYPETIVLNATTLQAWNEFLVYNL